MARTTAVVRESTPPGERPGELGNGSPGAASSCEQALAAAFERVLAEFEAEFAWYRRALAEADAAHDGARYLELVQARARMRALRWRVAAAFGGRGPE